MTVGVGVIISALVVVVGWWIVHWLNVHRDTLAKRRELRVQYLLEAYRRLEAASYRTSSDLPEAQRAFESAVADIQLLGTRAQIDALQAFLDDFLRGVKGAKVDDALKLLRNDLRKELSLEIDVPPVRIFRFERD